MIRQVKIAKDIAVKKVRTSAMISLKQVIIVNTPPELREELQPLTKMALTAKCARLVSRAGHHDHCVNQAAITCRRALEQLEPTERSRTPCSMRGRQSPAQSSWAFDAFGLSPNTPGRARQAGQSRLDHRHSWECAR